MAVVSPAAMIGRHPERKAAPGRDNCDLRLPAATPPRASGPRPATLAFRRQVCIFLRVGRRFAAGAIAFGPPAPDSTDLFAPGIPPMINHRSVLLALFLLFAALPGSAAGAEPPAAPPALDLQHAFPAPDAVNVCPDTPLRLTFPAPPTLGTTGRIRIVDAADQRVVETIDISSRTATKSIGGLPDYRYYPVITAGREATIYPKNGELAYGRSYYVTIDAGVFKHGAADYAGVDQPTAWRFSTKPAPPAPGTTRLTVAADGTGDFCTVQGALDFIPDGNTTPTTIFLRKGTYTEMVFFTHKDAITLLGEDRRQCVIAYATNERFNPAGGNPYADSSNPSAASHAGGHIYHRGVFLAHRVNDLTLTNLTIRNTTPQGGSQAEAIILNGTPTARAILKDVDLYSYQDTLQINGQAYLQDCYIEGDVDFMWGTGPCYFERCTCRALRSGAYFTQIRNPETNHGYVYDHSVFDGLPGINGNYLSRIGTGRFPHSEVVLLDCTLGNAVGPVAWLLSGGREGNPHDPAQIHFWEFNSRDAAGQPVDPSLRMPGSRRLREPDDAAVIADYRRPAFVLGHDWNPLAAPIFAAPANPPVAVAAPGAPVIVTQPASQLALLGTNPCLTVAAQTADGALTWQWSKDGHPLPGATAPVLRLRGMSWEDAGVYAVTVANAAGSVSSAPARLTAVAPAASPAPKLPAIPDATFDVTAYGARADGATDNTAAFQKAIDAALAAGGGTVVVPAAAKPWLCGPIALGSRLDLQIDDGATVQLLPYSPAANPPAGSYPRPGGRFANFITARNAHDVALTGGGTIDGDGAAWWAAFRADRHMPRRPDLIRFNDCERVLVSGLNLTHSPCFHCALTAVNDLTVFDVTVNTPDLTPNTDGIDPSGSHQLVQNCTVSDGDDNVVLKAGSADCTDITVADCAFGTGHGMSVGGQSNRGLDGMTVKDCTFDGTGTALRLKADATEGGPVQNITYSNLTMRNVTYPIVFYSYYRDVGNPGATEGTHSVDVAKVQAWNAAPPNPLASKTLPSWRNLTISNVTATGTKAWSIIWGLPLEDGLFANVRLNHVRILGGPGFKIFNAADVQFAGGTEVGPVLTGNALVITHQPENQTAVVGGSATFTVAAAGGGGASGTPLTYRWNFDEAPLSDGKGADGSVVSGATTPTLHLEDIRLGEGGRFSVTVTAALDGYDVATQKLAPGKLSVSATSDAAKLTIRGP